MDEEIEVYFPELVDKGKAIQFYANLKKRIQISIDRILERDVSDDEESIIEDYFYSLLKPDLFWGSDGFTVTHNKNFESACGIISQNTSRNPKEMITLEWMQILEDLRQQNKRHSGK